MKLKFFAAVLLVAIIAFGAVFFNFPHNKQMTSRIVQNMAKARPPMEGVEYRIPFVKYTAPPVQKYPESIVYAENAKLKFFELDGDYWTSLPFTLEGETRTEETATKAHIRFKFNPPEDPLHPGYSVRAIQSPLHQVTFQKANGEYFDLSTAPSSGWMKPLSAEAAAIWDLQAGDTFWIKVTTGKKITYAKFFVRLLSREGVAFDYVYQTDGTPRFPRPKS